MSHDSSIREHILDLLRGGNAHSTIERVVQDVPAAARGKRPDKLPYSLWEQLEHIRIAQWDILEFSRNPDHESPSWPDGYWPDSPEPPRDDAWEQSIAQFQSDLHAMQALVEDPDTDLYAPIPHGDGQTILREALLVADHNAYHLGQMVTVRRLLGTWE